MLTDGKAGRMFSMLHCGHPVAQIARRLEMGERTIRKYRDGGILPSQRERQPRDYRTRQDPLESFWPEIEELLKEDPRLRPFALLDWLKQKYNPPAGGQGELRVTDSIRRTLERRVPRWKLQHGVQQEVHFPQVHPPGDVIAFDFVVLNGLRVTIQGRPYDHMLFHAVFTYSNWEYVHLCHSESLEALATGLQDALHTAGGVPRRVRSDSLSAAVNNLSSDKQFAAQYQALLDHYGVRGHRINVVCVQLAGRADPHAAIGVEGCSDRRAVLEIAARWRLNGTMRASDDFFEHRRRWGLGLSHVVLPAGLPPDDRMRTGECLLSAHRISASAEQTVRPARWAATRSDLPGRRRSRDRAPIRRP